MKIFFSVGEPSGDLHGANLIRELKKRTTNLECIGYGGPRMKAAGCELHEDLTKLAVMFVLRVVLNLHRFCGLLLRADTYFREHRPDAVVLIDYPGFNWWIARRAKRHGIPVFYYGVPQMWAWAGWRVKKMRRLIDHVLCKLPFEADWFQARGCHATYVGHPYFDEVCHRKLDSAFVESIRRDQPLVAILPGSRTQEVISNLPWFLRTAKLVIEQVPDARFAIAAFNDKQAAMARQLVQQTKVEAEVYVGRTPELIEAAYCCLACSGSVSLELLYHEKPTIILYHIGRFTYFVQQFFLNVRYITLVNLLAAKHAFKSSVFGRDVQSAEAKRADDESVPFPEFLTWQDKSAEMASRVVEWMAHPADYVMRVYRLQQLKRAFARPGASSSAAEYILAALNSASSALPDLRIRDAA